MSNIYRGEEIESLIAKVGPLGHIPQYKEEPPMLDIINCSCGDFEETFYDGIEFAWDAWIKHANSVIQKNMGT